MVDFFGRFSKKGIWQLQVTINAKLLRLYKEAPYKTIIHDYYGCCPAVVYNKDQNGQRRKPRPIDFVYKNEAGMSARVWGLVSEGSSLWYLPWINKFNRLMLYDWDFDHWIETDVSWGAQGRVSCIREKKKTASVCTCPVFVPLVVQGLNGPRVGSTNQLSWNAPLIFRIRYKGPLGNFPQRGICTSNIRSTHH